MNISLYWRSLQRHFTVFVIYRLPYCFLYPFEYKRCINRCLIIKHYYACIDVLQDCSHDRMPYNILHNCDSAHQYVCVDGLSDCFYEWMLYQILHWFNGVHHYVCFDDLSDCSVDVIPYSIPHSYKRDHHYVCAGH